MASDIVKASFNLPRAELEQLKHLAHRRNIPVTQALRQALVSEQFIQNVADQHGKLLVQESDGSVQEIVFAQTRSVSEAPAEVTAMPDERHTPAPAVPAVH
jgi:hypothetical protein